MTGERPTGERPTGAAPDPADEPGLEQPGLEQDGLEQPVPDELAGQQGYPQVQPELPPRSRGVIGLLEENCTACMLCARECPDWCLYVESHDEVVEDPHGGRPRTRHVLDRFAIDYGLCMYCGICVEVCPFDALFWSPEFAYAETEPGELTHEQDRLRAWMWTVPPPPALDPGPDAGDVSGSS